MSQLTKMSLKSVPKSSSFIKHLKAESEIPSVQEAIKLYESSDETSKTKRFNTPRTLASGGAYQFTIPTKRPEYQHLISSPNALEALKLDRSQPNDPDYQKLVSGETFHYDEGIFPYAQAYAGFQFGQFAGQLGDGRVINLFQLHGKDGNTYDLQLKGAGKTAFSRFADGKAVLRSSIREFIVSESLNGIGIPTTRALSLTALPKTKAQREYAETCAVYTRFARSWIRIGTFDWYRYSKDRKGLRQLSDYILENVLTKDEIPDINLNEYKIDKYKDQTEAEEETKGSAPSPEEEDEEYIEINDTTRYEQLYRAIVRLNAKTVAYWQVYGFLNGVLNTDNTSILGLSIDFGPFSFLDRFDPNFTPNHDDSSLRYSFANQPSIIWWNLTRLGESLVELIGIGPKLVDDEYFIENGAKQEWAQDILKRANTVIHLVGNEYKAVFMENYNSLFGKRLGLVESQEGDNNLFAQLLEILLKTKVGYNGFFVKLQKVDFSNKSSVYKIFLNDEDFQRLSKPEDKVDRERNEEITTLIDTWIQKFTERLSKEHGSNLSKRADISQNFNPKFIPSNWVLDEVIQTTNDDLDDVSTLEKLLKMSSNPYDDSKWGDDLKELETKWLDNNDDSKTMWQCSCSS